MAAPAPYAAGVVPYYGCEARMRERRLTLRKDTLAELTAGELCGVVGGTCPATLDVRACLAQTLTGCPGYYCTGTV